MTKGEILKYFEDINYAYNDCTRYDILSDMLNELEQEQVQYYKDLAQGYERVIIKLIEAITERG